MRTPEQKARHLRQLQALRNASGHDLDAAVRKSLRNVWEAGGSPPRIAVRSSFIALSSPPGGMLSDRAAAPDDAERPALARLPSPRGLALRLELVALFVAQCGNGARSVARMKVDPADGIGWRQLVLGPSSVSPGAVRAVTWEDNRIRQIKGALDRLAEPTVGLMGLPHAESRSNKYADPVLMVEAGTTENGPATRYTRPTGGNVVDIPAEFFLNGWVHVLDDSEIAAWLMFRHCTRGGTSTLSGDERLGVYTLRIPTWRKHTDLNDYGLLDAAADPNRRMDGTIEDRPENGNGMLTRFTMIDAGLARDALDTVIDALMN